MSEAERPACNTRLPIDRRVGFLDQVLADAVDWYVAHPLHKEWTGGERGDPYMLEESEEYRRRADEAAQCFIADLGEAIRDFHLRLQDTLRGEIISDPRYPDAGDIELALHCPSLDRTQRLEKYMAAASCRYPHPEQY